MSPLNRGPMVGPRVPPAAMRPPPMMRFNRVPLPPPMPRGVPPLPPGPMFNPRGRRHIPPPPPPMMAPIPPGPPGMYGPPPPRGRPAMPPMPPMPPMPLRGGPLLPHGPMMRPGPRGVLPPHALPHMRPRFPNNNKGKNNNSSKKSNKIEELEMKKPWMTDEIRSEIQKKNKLYAKAKKNKDAKEWEEFKDLRNKVTRMIRDAKNEYLAKNPEQAHLYENDKEFEYNENDDDSDAEENETSNSNLYCETCDREFQSEEMLERHVNEHQTCKIDGCTFTAHPKIVEKHISMQHSTGLYQRMKSVMSDGDIQKWRAERKKRYPTAVNVKIQESERFEKEKRGEVIKKGNDEKQRRVPARKDQVKKNRKRKRNKQIQAPIYREPVKQQIYRGLKPFAGTTLLDENVECDEPEQDKVAETCDNTVINEETCNVDIIDEENIVIEDPIIDEKSNAEPIKNISLVADYGSDSENDEPPEEVPIKKSKPNEETEILSKSETQTEPIKPAQIVEETKSSVPVIKDAENQRHRSEKSINQKKNNNPKRNNSEYSNGRLRLLNKLLARSIQHERNAIFQCITFIANNNFFDE